MTKARRLATGAVVLALGAVAAVWIYRHFSPFHVCVRYYTLEATEAGQSLEEARRYATGLCTAKNPFRN